MKTKTKKSTLSARIQKAFDDGVKSGMATAEEYRQRRFQESTTRRKLAFYTYQGAVGTALTNALKTLVEQLDKIDRAT